MLQLELIELLFAIHLNDERDNEDEECGAGDPGGFTGAPQQFIGDESSI